MNQKEMLVLLERILDSPFEADKWRHQAELAYMALGGQKQSLIAPKLRERLAAKRQERQRYAN